VWQVQGGVVYNPTGQQKLTCAWGLRETSDNQVEALALLQRLMLLDARHVNNLVVIGDSMVIIQQMMKL